MQVQERSVTNAARREQIVAAAMEVISEQGYPSATFGNIATHAGIKSTRTISYHFSGKDDLMSAVVQHVFGVIHEFLAERVAAHDDPREALAAYIRNTVDLNRAHRVPMRALLRIFLEHHPADGSPVYGTTQEANALSPLEQILTDGQRQAVFRDFDVWVMATTVQRSLDGVPFLLESRPDLDLEHYAEELVAAFVAATSSDRGAGNPPKA